MDEGPRNLRIGTSGWSYPSGKGTWNGIFYPAVRRARPGGGRFDELAYYAEHFDTVEVNSTFYRIPSVDVVRSWVRRTPPGFEFSVKLYQKFTHPAMFEEATGDPDTSVARSDIDRFRRAIDPLASAGKMGALLVQFPPSFKSGTDSLAYLEWLVGSLKGYRVAVELRHRSWSDGLADTLSLLNDFGVAWVQIDEPKFRFSIQQNYLPNVTGFYYMRLHGRNAKQWWHHEAGEDRYNYAYSAKELEPFAETADAARRLVRKMYLYLNNHFAAKAVANAVMLKHALHVPVEGEYPPEFVSHFPELAGIVTTPRPAPAPTLFG